MKKKSKTGLWTAIGCAAVIVFCLCLKVAKLYIRQDDFTPFLQWWLVLLVTGVGFYPLSAFLFRRFSDKGYFFGKVLGIAISGWLVWVLTSVHLMKFTATGCYIVLGLCILLNYGIAFWFCKKKKVSFGNFFGITDGSGAFAKILWYEVIFFALFAFLTYIKCFNPQAYDTERPMDYGFMVSMMKSDYMPPEDFWCSGTDLNYYYMGQFFATYLTKLSGVTVNYGYNLALMMNGALCMILVYSLVARIFEVFLWERNEEYRLLGKKTVASNSLFVQSVSRIAGVLSGLAVTFASSCHYFIYAKVIPVVREMLGMEGDSGYFFANSTRYIGHQRTDIPDETIHEFPSYSFVLGDLHAHVTNIIFVITLLAVLFAFLLYRRERMKRAVAGVLEDISYKRELLQPHIIVLSFLIGIFQMTNYWDFPIYFVVCGAVILVSNAVICGFSKKTILLTAVHAAEFIVISYVTAFLFHLHFVSMASGIGICDRHTLLYQMIIVWGFPIILVISYLVMLIKEEQQRRKERLSKTEHKNVFFAWLQNLKTADLFLIILGLCAIGLVLLPELVYIKDIYGSTHQRTNTMFKLTYQAFILFGICMGAMITRYVALPKNGKQFVAGLVFLYLLCQNVGYFKTASTSYLGDYTNPEKYKSLDAAAYIYNSLPEDAAAIEWINNTLEGRPVILEAHGDSYTQYNRVSILTGCPTVIGWRTHEWLWKNNVEIVNERAKDVETIYTCRDVKTAKQLLEAYEVDYLYVGLLERQKYMDVTGVFDYDYLRSLGEVVYESDAETYYQTFIVKVK